MDQAPKFLVRFVLKKINLRSVLYLMAFLAFGIGDGITSAYMMDSLGPNSESNLILRELFVSLGFADMIAIKLFLTMIFLLAIHMVELHSVKKIYWAVNCTLFSFIAAGLTGAYFNIRVINGSMPQEPGEIIIFHVVLVLLFVEIGALIDSYNS